MCSRMFFARKHKKLTIIEWRTETWLYSENKSSKWFICSLSICRIVIKVPSRLIFRQTSHYNKVEISRGDALIENILLQICFSSLVSRVVGYFNSCYRYSFNLWFRMNSHFYNLDLHSSKLFHFTRFSYILTLLFYISHLKEVIIMFVIQRNECLPIHMILRCSSSCIRFSTTYGVDFPPFNENMNYKSLTTNWKWDV